MHDEVQSVPLGNTCLTQETLLKTSHCDGGMAEEYIKNHGKMVTQ